MDYKKVLENKEVKAFLKKGNENLGVLGYTDHSEKHCAIVAKRAGDILGITMLDHIIIGDSYYSYRENCEFQNQ